MAKAGNVPQSKKRQARRTVKKWVYFFGAGKAEGDGTWRDLLGGKGAGLAEMTKIGLPVPAGFTISTEACDYFYKNAKKYPPELKKQVVDNVAKLERTTRKKLGDPKNPLLVSVRSGSARSMPGMMETILNLGLNDRSVEGLSAVTKNERFAYDAYRRFVQITGIIGTAVNVVQMVFGNTGDTSGTGVCFTRDPSTGEKIFYGDYLVNAQGEDVVAGIRTPMPLREMQKTMPKVYGQLEKVRVKLEKHYRDMQDMEFTVEDGKLYMLQTRAGKRTPAATFRIAVDMANERLITKEEALLRVKPEAIQRLFYPVIDPKVDRNSLTSNILATCITPVPGAAAGTLVFSAP